MNIRNRIVAVLLTMAALLTLFPAALTATAEEVIPDLIITEVCFNPTFRVWMPGIR
ncbi:MAG: hypothetical protein IJX72_02440 [Clostridia bacterium]|nr:hypothetical protein [Clostridia bacterium]